MQENIRQDLELTAQHSTNLHSTVYYLKTQDCYKLNNSMLKSNITNLQFILDNKPQYSISFDKQQEKNRFQPAGLPTIWFLGTSVRYGIETQSKAEQRTSQNWKPKPNRKTELPTIRFGFGSVRFGVWFSVKKRPG